MLIAYFFLQKSLFMKEKMAYFSVFLQMWFITEIVNYFNEIQKRSHA